MALHNTASVERRPAHHGEGALVDLVALQERLEERLLTDEQELCAARERGERSEDAEADWVRMLRRYERVCDLLARTASSTPLPAA